MAETDEIRRYQRLGLAAVVVGGVVALVGAVFAHFTGLPAEDALGVPQFTGIPRGWVWVLLGQTVSLVGSLMLLGGLAVAFCYKRPMTWARASIGAFVFTSVMMILFAIIPNQWLTLTQSEFAWTPQKIALTIPPALVLGSEVAISFAAVKDIVSGTYAVVMLGVVAVTMYQWQEQKKKAASAPPPRPISDYGRPLVRVRK